MSLSITIPGDLDEDVVTFALCQIAAMDAAEAIAQIARDTAPVVTGAYEAGIEVQAFTGGARVIATDFVSGWVEFGAPGNNVPPQFILRNAVLSAGYRFKVSRG